MKRLSLLHCGALAFLLAGLLGLSHQASAVSLTLVSRAVDGTAGGGGAPSISDNGRYVAFQADTSNLVPDDTNGETDVFVRDLKNNTTKRVSIATDGTQSNDYSGEAKISADGRFVTFESKASNLVPNDNNSKFDIFVRDLQNNTTILVSATPTGAPGNGNSQIPSISADGRFVAFGSSASDLVADDSDGVTGSVFVRDIQTKTTILVSRSTDGTQKAAAIPQISPDGNYVTFATTVTDVVPGDINGFADIFLRDLQNNTTTLVSVATDGTQGNNESFPYSNATGVSAGGRFVAFESKASNLAAGDTNGDGVDVYLRDLQNHTTTLISTTPGNTSGNGPSGHPAMSADGRYVAFYSLSTDLVSGDTNGKNDVFVRDLQTNKTSLVSTAADGTQGNGLSTAPALSSDGRYVLFHSLANNWVSDDTDATADVFVRDQRVVSATASGRTFTYAPSPDFASTAKTPLSDVKVTLQNSGGAPLATVNSDSTGSYSFTSLDSGSYSVSAELVRSGQPTLALKPTSQSFTVTESDIALLKFSLYSIFGVIKCPNASNVVGPRAGVVLTLKNASGEVLATKTTLADGRFTFGKLAAGTYSLSAAKSGLTFTDATGLVLPGTVAPFAPALKKSLTGTRNSDRPAPTGSGAKF